LVLFTDSLDELLRFFLLYRGLLHLAERCNFRFHLLRFNGFWILFWGLFLEGQFGLALGSGFRFGFDLIALIDFEIIVIECLLDVLVAPF
jgi:hypothetical protein